MGFLTLDLQDLHDKNTDNGFTLCYIPLNSDMNISKSIKIIDNNYFINYPGSSFIEPLEWIWDQSMEKVILNGNIDNTGGKLYTAWLTKEKRKLLSSNLYAIKKIAKYADNEIVFLCNDIRRINLSSGKEEILYNKSEILDMDVMVSGAIIFIEHIKDRYKISIIHPKDNKYFTVYVSQCEISNLIIGKESK